MRKYNYTDIIEKDFCEHENLILFNLADTHVGNPFFNEKLFKETLETVKNIENAYIVLGGDLIENNTKNSVGSVYEQTMTPKDQRDYIVDYLQPLKHKILGSVQGNHEHRKDNKNADNDVAEDIARMIGVPYNPYSLLFYLRIGKNPANKNRPISYSIFLRHGSGRGSTPASAVNGSIKGENIVLGCDVYFSGHHHQELALLKTHNVFYQQSKSIRTIDSLFIQTGSYIDYGGYGAAGAMPPKSLGSKGVILSGKKRSISEISVDMVKLYFSS
jgi:predicted phosphodiesterase